VKKIRVVHGTASQGAAVELYLANTASGLGFTIMSNDGWTSAPWTYGGVPGGFGSVQLELDTMGNPVFGTASGTTNNGFVILRDGNAKVQGNTVWHAGNDGHTGGLDADMVDGVHLSDLDSRYINSDGDTLNGMLTLSKVGYTALTVDGLSTFNDAVSMESHRITSVADPINIHDAATKGYVDLLARNIDWQESVLDLGVNTPPGTNGADDAGERYIVGASPTGVWVSHANDIAEWNTEDGSTYSWLFTEADEGLACWVQDEDTLYIWNGTAWVKMGSTTVHNVLSSIQGGTTNEYYHLTSAEHTALRGGGTNDASSLHVHDALYFTESESDVRFIIKPAVQNGFLNYDNTTGQITWKTITGGAGYDSDTLDNMQPTPNNVGTSVVSRDTNGDFAGGAITAESSLKIRGGTTPNFYTSVFAGSTSQGAIINYTLPAAGASAYAVLTANSSNVMSWVNYSSSNIGSTMMYRDANGDFSCRNITGTSFSGNSGTATKLAATKTIAVSGDATSTAQAFDGSANISVPITVTKINGVEPSTTAVSSVVLRDSSGDFHAGTIFANLTGTATQATNADTLDDKHATDFTQKSTNSIYNDTISSGTMPNAITTPRAYATAINDGNGHIYVMGGAASPAPNAASNKNEMFDVTSKTWTTKAVVPMSPLGTYHCAAGLYNGYIYYVGGDNNYSSGAHAAYVGRYSISGDTWTTTSSSNLPYTGWSDTAYAQIGQYLYLMGGHYWTGTAYEYTFECWKLDMANPNTNVSWTQESTMDEPQVNRAEAVAINGKIYVFGGKAPGTTSNPTSGSPVANVCTYDPDASLWWPAADMPATKVGHVVASAGTYIYILGGASTNTTIYRYDTQSDTYETLPALLYAVQDAPGTINGGGIYTFGYNGTGTMYGTTYCTVVGHVLVPSMASAGLVGMLSSSKGVKALESSACTGLRGAAIMADAGNSVFAHYFLPNSKDGSDVLAASIFVIS
jgi:hypothetical protein